MRVSVIVPVYNGGKYICKTLATILCQDFSDYEILVVDDGSRDGTAEIVREFFQNSSSPGVGTHVIRQKHSGTSVARNKGIASAEGKYLYFFDADDLMKRGLLSKMYHKAEETDADVVFCGFDRVSPDGGVLSFYDDSYDYLDNVSNGESATVRMLRGEIRVWNGNAIYRASGIVHNSLQYTPGCSFVQDGEFILKALVSAKRVACVRESLVNYVQREGSASRKTGKKMFHAVGAMRRVRKYMESRDVSDETLNLMDTRFIPTAYVAALDAVAISKDSTGEISRILSSDVVRDSLKNSTPETGLPLRRVLLLKYFPRLFFKYRSMRAKASGHN